MATVVEKKRKARSAQSLASPLPSADDAANAEDDNAAGRLVPRRRVAFVSVGATAGFCPLVREVLSEPFIAKLLELGYTQLVIQCGPDSEIVEAHFPREEEGEDEEIEELQLQQQSDDQESDEKVAVGDKKASADETKKKKELRERRNSFIRNIAVFAYTSEMTKWMRLAAPGTDEDGGQRDYGVIISHAGPFELPLCLSLHVIAKSPPLLLHSNLGKKEHA